MNYRLVSVFVLGVLVLLLTHAHLSLGGSVVAGPVHEVVAEKRPIRHAQANSCLPRYGEQQYILQVNDTGPYDYEPALTSGDFNDDGLEDIVITKGTGNTTETYPLDILLNDGNGSLDLATSSIFSGTIPAVQHHTEVIVADFNGDGRSDIYVADHGYDLYPHPGYQNQLALSTIEGKLVDATDNLPQQSDFTHSACAADIDHDQDIDLYVGNYWGQNPLDPQILLNDGSGKYTESTKPLPPLMSLNQNGYTSCAFGDVNNDGSPDLILGDGGDGIDNEYSTPNSEVLVNDGTGAFSLLPNAMPSKRSSRYDIGHDIELIDLNGDEYVDILIVYEAYVKPDEGGQGSYIQALVNNQDGTFRNETASRLEPLDRSVWIPDLELRDLDHDNDLDLLALPWDDRNPNPILFLNDGSGHFGRKRIDFKLTYIYHTFLDLDGDSGHDIVMATYAPPEDIYAIRDIGCSLFLPFVHHP